MARSISTVIRAMLDNRLNTEMILEEVKKKNPGLMLLRHDKKTGDMAYIHMHPKSKNHVIYSSSMEGQRSDAILHRNDVEEMMKLLSTGKEKK